MVQVHKNGNKKTLCECLFGRIEWTRPSASEQVNLQRAKRADRKVVRTAKPQLCCAKGEHNQVHKMVTKKHSASVCLVGLSGLEPPTPTLSGWCSNLLSYNPIVCGGDTRIRLIASDCACTSKRASARACPRGHHKVMRCARNGMRVYSPMVEIHGFEPRTS